MAGRLEGKVAIVTGGSSGIGRAIAERFAAEGAHVVVASRRLSACRRVARAFGGEAVRCDVRRESDVRRLFARRRVDIAVANAGIWVGGRVERISTRAWNAVVATNLTGVFFTVREAFRAMRRCGGGTILVISSVAGLDAWEGNGAYSATKFGVRGLARAAADEGRRLGIKVSCICPGMVATPMAGRRPRGEPIIRPEDVAEAALYLTVSGRDVIVHDLVLDRRTEE